MSDYLNKYNCYTHPAINGDLNWDIDQFIADVNRDGANRIYLIPDEMKLENSGIAKGKNDVQHALLFTRKKNYKIVEIYEHHHMSKPRFEKDICVATSHVILITTPPYTGGFQEVQDMNWKKTRDKDYNDHMLYYHSYGYTVDVDYWLPRLRQYLHARYY